MERAGVEPACLWLPEGFTIGVSTTLPWRLVHLTLFELKILQHLKGFTIGLLLD